MHHTATPLSVVGGGTVPRPGELFRSHQGVLLLDEFLEFSKKVQEVLRGPMEDGTIRVSRAAQAQDFPFESLVVGTTNLCPCGDWVPYRGVRCGRSLYKCRSYRERLSGPVLDRFQLLFYAFPKGGSGARIQHHKEPWPSLLAQKDEVLGEELLKNLLEVYEFQKNRRKRYEQPSLRNSRQPMKELLKGVDGALLKLQFAGDLYNPRRRYAIISVARTMADLDFSMEIKTEHFNQAKEWAGVSFEKIKNLT